MEVALHVAEIFRFIPKKFAKLKKLKLMQFQASQTASYIEIIKAVLENSTEISLVLENFNCPKEIWFVVKF
jgi:hypothetical protein